MSTSNPLIVSRFVGLFLLFALVALTFWGLESRSGASLPSGELVVLELAAPAEPPATLLDSMTNGAIAELDVLVDEARRQMMQEAPSSDAGSRADFVGRYTRHSYSAIASLLEAPSLARVEDLLRSVELNPLDVQFPAQAIANLDRLVSAYRDVIVEAVELRDIESHHQTLLLASCDGLLSIDSLRTRIPQKAREEFSRAARAKSPTEGPEFKRILLAFESQYLQELMRADVVLIHGGGAYLAPEGSVLPKLVHYENFVGEQTVAMIYDVLEFFSKHGALDQEQVEGILRSVDTVIAGDPG